MSAEDFRRLTAKATIDLPKRTDNKAAIQQLKRDLLRGHLQAMRDYVLDEIELKGTVTRKTLDFYIKQSTIKL